MDLKTDFLSFLVLISLFSCSKNDLNEQAHIPYGLRHLDFPLVMSDIAPEEIDIPEYDLSGRPVLVNHSLVRVPPGSDQLQQIILEASPNAEIRLLPGLHKESSTLVIPRKIRLTGEEGSILVLGGTIGIFVDRSEYVQIRGLEIKNAGNSYLALAGSNSDNLSISENDFSGFPLSILIEQCDHTLIRDNIVLGTGDFSNDLGITVVNGAYSDIRGNEVFGTAFGIWISDRDGVAQANYTHDNLIGMMLCRIPEGSIPFGGGSGGSLRAATSWKLMDNRSDENAWGFLLIDGANNNLLVDNLTLGNVFTDVELASETEELFGFPTSATFENIVQTGPYELEVVNCGSENNINGEVAYNGPCSK